MRDRPTFSARLLGKGGPHPGLSYDYLSYSRDGCHEPNVLVWNFAHGAGNILKAQTLYVCRHLVYHKLKVCLSTTLLL